MSVYHFLKNYFRPKLGENFKFEKENLTGVVLRVLSLAGLKQKFWRH